MMKKWSVDVAEKSMSLLYNISTNQIFKQNVKKNVDLFSKTSVKTSNFP